MNQWLTKIKRRGALLAFSFLIFFFSFGLTVKFFGWRHNSRGGKNAVTNTAVGILYSTSSTRLALANLSLNETGRLPIGNIEIHNAPDAWGAVALIPQSHRYPGSSPSDAVNDTAEAAQKEIYEIMGNN